MHFSEHENWAVITRHPAVRPVPILNDSYSSPWFGLAANNCHNDLPGVRSPAVLEEEDPLPSSEEHAAGGDGDGFRRPGQGHAKVTGHVIGTFAGVLKPRRVFRDKTVEKFMQILASRGVGVFHDYKATTGVSDEHGDDSLRDPAGFEDFPHPVRDLDRALSPGFNPNGIVLDLEWLHGGMCDPATWIAR